MQQYVLLLAVSCLFPQVSASQDTLVYPTVQLSRDSIPAYDSLAPANDSVTSIPDSLAGKKNRQAISSPVKYSSSDSIIYALGEQKVYLHNQSSVEYEEIKLDANYIEFNMSDETVFARGVEDSAGTLQGKPVFAEGSEQFESLTLNYNFRSKKGIIKEIFTEQEGGYLHSKITKRQPNEEIHLKQGKYTTCDAPNPHFYLALTKAKSIPNDKIVSGPAYLVLEDVPLPIGIPFGFFPNTKTSKSGVLMPQYGEETKRGFYLRNGGYYLALSKYFDFKLTGDIYTNGTWASSVGSNYRKRYRFSGNLLAKFAENISGEKGVPKDPLQQEPGYSKTRDFAINWSHNKDSKANPNQSFTASVNFSTSGYDRNHSRNINNVMQSSKQSSINFSKQWPNSPFNFSGSLSANQNSLTKNIGLRLPQMAMNMNRIYPLRRKNRTGPGKWWEDLQLSYTSSIENKLNANESQIFKSTWDDFDKAYQHNIPLSLNLKALNYFTITPSVRYTGVVFTKSINPQFIEDFTYPETGIKVDTFIIDTVPGFRYAHAYVPSVGVNFSPKIYGMFQFREQSKVVAIRHVMTPSASFSYVPNMKGKVPNYYQDVVIDTAGHLKTYPIYDESIYRIPVPSGRSGSVSLSLKNNVEMKLKPESDTIKEFKKIKLLDNFNFTTNYDVFKDSMKWSPIRMNGNTRLFNNLVSVRISGTFDPYAYYKDVRGNYRVYNKALFKTTGQLVRLSNFDFSTGMNFKSGQGKEKSSADANNNDPTAPVERATQYEEDILPGGYVDFEIPWTFNCDYNFRYTKNKDKPDIVQSVRFRGDFSLTPKWKIGFNSGYDFSAKKMTMTNVSIYRDLHCWEMQVSLVPFGSFRSYSFQINIKSAVLKDLKYEKGDNWYDNF